MLTPPRDPWEYDVTAPEELDEQEPFHFKNLLIVLAISMMCWAGIIRGIAWLVRHYR